MGRVTAEQRDLDAVETRLLQLGKKREMFLGDVRTPQ
jgi:hypothetical protein